MSTRSLPTPPPEGTAVLSTEADQATPQTTDIEEAAGPANQPPPPQSQPIQLRTIYREVFPAIANKAIDKDWSGLAMLAELQDLRVRSRSHTFNRTPNVIFRDLQTEHDADASRMLLTAPLVLSYLILDDVYDFKLASPSYLLILKRSDLLLGSHWLASPHHSHTTP